MKGEHDPAAEALAWLERGEITLTGRFVQSWNQVFLAQVDDGEQQGLAVYKPQAGEYPLWDFPHSTLCLREAAAYRLSRALGWPLIPPTVLRDGPLGFGMLQQYIEADPEAHFFTLREERLADFIPVALFDYVTNNTDRKSGHVLLDSAGRIWAIDHALTFHAEPKLRTVIWEFAGEPIPASYLADMQRIHNDLAGESPLREALTHLLSQQEAKALQERLTDLLATGRLPEPDPKGINIPWPLV